MHAPTLNPQRSIAAPFKKALIAGAVTTALLGALAFIAPTSGAAAATLPASTQTQPLTTLPGSFADLVSTVRPAVVNVSVEGAVARVGHHQRRPRATVPDGLSLPPALRRFFEQQLNGSREVKPQSVGSGFIVDASGLVVTNHHVVRDAENITVTLHDGRKFPATLRGADPKTDLALLEINAGESLTAVSFGDSDRTRVGDWVLAVGNPFGLGGTVTAGIVSARGRDIGSGPYDDFIQVDAPINRGNSGGPLFNRAGEVIGINTAIFSPSGGSVGIGFAIPASLAEPLVAELRDSGRVARGWLGVEIQAVGEEMAAGLGLESTDGALVASVAPGGPAQRAGILPGDVITAIGGKAVNTVRELSQAAALLASGSEQELLYFRQAKAEQTQVRIGRYPSTPVAGAGPATPTKEGHLGLAVTPSEDNQGVLVTAVEPNSPAGRVGIRAGDVILRAGSIDIGSTKDLEQSVADAAQAERPVVLLVRRGDGQRFISIKELAG